MNMNKNTKLVNLKRKKNNENIKMKANKKNDKTITTAQK